MRANCERNFWNKLKFYQFIFLHHSLFHRKCYHFNLTILSRYSTEAYENCARVLSIFARPPPPFPFFISFPRRQAFPRRERNSPRPIVILPEPSITETRFIEKVYGKIEIGTERDNVDNSRYWLTDVCVVPDTNSIPCKALLQTYRCLIIKWKRSNFYSCRSIKSIVYLFGADRGVLIAHVITSTSTSPSVLSFLVYD